MSHTKLDYIKLLQEFAQKNNCDVFKKTNNYKGEIDVLVTRNSYYLTDNYKNSTHDVFDTKQSEKIESVSFHNDTIIDKLVLFLNEKNERWNVFLSHHELSKNFILSALTNVSEKYFYTLVNLFKYDRYCSLNEDNIKFFFEKAKKIEPFHAVLVAEYFANFKNQFKNQSLVVALANQTYDLPDDDKKIIYNALGIAHQLKSIETANDDFLTTTKTISFSLDKLKLSNYLTNLSEYQHDLIDKDTIWKNLETITKFFSKKNTHKRDFLLHSVVDGYSNSHTDYKIYIQTSENFNNSTILCDFIKQALVNLCNNSIQKKTDKYKYDYLKKLFDSMYLDFKLNQQEHSEQKTNKMITLKI